MTDQAVHPAAIDKTRFVVICPKCFKSFNLKTSDIQLDGNYGSGWAEVYCECQHCGFEQEIAS